MTTNAPDWDSAPQWANWQAQDPKGEWWWFEHVVERHDNGWEWANSNGVGRLRKASDPPDWQDTLQGRPVLVYKTLQVAKREES